MIIERLLRHIVGLAFLAASAALWWPQAAESATVKRIKEVASVQGVRSNPLTGFGLVVGLDGTGDQTTQAPFTAQSIAAMLQQMGIAVPAGTVLQTKNVASVTVTTSLPPYAQPGQTLDVVVSSIANAKSLRGGTLLTTPLKGPDGQIYALAQGNLMVGGAGASAGGAKVQINHLSVGTVPGGGIVERAVPTMLHHGDHIQLDLVSSDYHLARAVARAINDAKGEGVAQAIDGRVVRVRVPPGAERVSFLADIENIPIELAKPVARVVINARTGSIVLNEAVTLGACAVAHGNLSVTITSTPVASQPNSFSQGQTVQAEKNDISITQSPGPLIQMAAGTQLQDVVKALSALGATPQDLVAILTAMKAAGALQAELDII